MKKITAFCIMLAILFCLAACDNQPQTGSPSNSETSVNGNGDNIVQNEDITTKDIITPTKGDGDISFDFESCTVTLNSGYEMPIMGLGTYSLSDEECYNSVTALETVMAEKESQVEGQERRLKELAPAAVEADKQRVQAEKSRKRLRHSFSRDER